LLPFCGSLDQCPKFRSLSQLRTVQRLELLLLKKTNSFQMAKKMEKEKFLYSKAFLEDGLEVASSKDVDKLFGRMASVIVLFTVNDSVKTLQRY
jgi:hypothetical protein